MPRTSPLAGRGPAFRLRPAARWACAAAVALVVAALVVGLLARALGWVASDGTVTDLNVRVDVLADGSLRIEEAGAVRFERVDGEAAVQRLLPTHESTAGGRFRATPIEEVSVVDDAGRTVPVEISDLGRELRLRFELAEPESEEPSEGAGERRYTLAYTVSGAVVRHGSGRTGFDRTLTAAGFGLPVERVRVRLFWHLVGDPSLSSSEAACLVGSATEPGFCPDVDLRGHQIRLAAHDLAADDRLRFAWELEPGLPDVPAATADAVDAGDTVAAPVATGSTVVRRVAAVMAVLLAIGAFATIRQSSPPRVWRRWRRRAEMPVGIHPAEAGVLLDRVGAPYHLSASLLDLVRRGFVEMSGTGPDAVLRQRPTGAARDELALHEWSLLMKVFRSADEVTLAEVRDASPGWSGELLRSLRRQAIDNGWRHRAAVAVFQRLGWLGAIGLAVLAYLVLVVLGVTVWVDMPASTLVGAAVIVVAWSAGCAMLMSATITHALTFRGRWWYADLATFAHHVDRRGVDDDDPSMGIWAIALGVRPDPFEFPPPDPEPDSESESERQMEWEPEPESESEVDPEPEVDAEGEAAGDRDPVPTVSRRLFDDE